MLSSSSTIRIRSATSETLGPAEAALCSGRAVALSIGRRYEPRVSNTLALG